MPFTLRETHVLFRNRRVWAGLAVVGVVVAIIGPFGTYASHSLVERLAYWSVIVVGTFWIGTVGSELVQRFFLQGRVRGLGAAVLLHLLVPIPITGFVVLIALPFGVIPRPLDAALLYANCAALSVAISALSALVAAGLALPARPVVVATRRCLTRLAPSRRGDLVRLSAQGHYVEVVTTQGRALLLMRLKDAIAETAPEAGVRVHRSHWIAVRFAAPGGRRGAQAFVRTADGMEVPVSRSMSRTVRAAGLLR